MRETKNAIIDDMNIRRECACFYQTAGHTFYFIFDDGTVRSTRNVLSDPKTWRVIASYNGKGYRRVRIEGKTYKVHRLVATHFVPNPCDYPYVLHIDGNKENNDVTNLQWSDKQSNHSDES
jgi:hypothetical protein